jgi:hypothetical protein
VQLPHGSSKVLRVSGSRNLERTKLLRVGLRSACVDAACAPPHMSGFLHSQMPTRNIAQAYTVCAVLLTACTVLLHCVCASVLLRPLAAAAAQAAEQGSPAACLTTVHLLCGRCESLTYTTSTECKHMLLLLPATLRSRALRCCHIQPWF